MAQSKRVRNFIETVCGQVESERKRNLIANELISRIEDQTRAFMEEGLDEDTAEIKAVIQMGNPISVGKNLNERHRPKHDWLEIIPNIVIGTVAGIIIAFGIFCGAATLYSLFKTGDYIIGVLICGGFIAGSFIIAFTAVSVYKAVSNMFFYRGLYKDYEKRKKKGETYGKY